MGDRMEDETPRGGYKEELLSAAGKRERAQAHTGMTPPAKAASPGHNDIRHAPRRNESGNIDGGFLNGRGDSPSG